MRWVVIVPCRAGGRIIVPNNRQGTRGRWSLTAAFAAVNYAKDAAAGDSDHRGSTGTSIVAEGPDTAGVVACAVTQESGGRAPALVWRAGRGAHRSLACAPSCGLALDAPLRPREAVVARMSLEKREIGWGLPVALR